MNLTEIDNSYNVEQKDKLYAEWYRLATQEHYTHAEIARAYGSTSDIIRKRLQRWRNRNHVELPATKNILSADDLDQHVKSIKIGDLALPKFKESMPSEPPILEFEDCLITSDWEIPDTDPFMIRAAFLVAIKHGIRRHIINGDYVSNDVIGINSFDPLYAEDGIHFDQQKKIADKTTYAMLQWFTEGIWMTYGNHEDKLNRATKGEVGMYHVLTDEVQIVRYPYLWLKTSRGYAFIVHPANYSPNSAALGKRLYNVWLTPEQTKPRFIVLGHTHIDQTGWSEDGYCEIYGTGTMRNPNVTAYIRRKATTFPKWNQSFVIFKNGYVYKYSRNATDWAYELGSLVQYLDKPIPERLLLDGN